MWSWYHYTGTEIRTIGPFVLRPDTINGLPVLALEQASQFGIDPASLVECRAPWDTPVSAAPAPVTPPVDVPLDAPLS